MSVQYIKFDITSSDIVAFSSELRHKVFFLDDKKSFFTIDVTNDISILVSSKDSVALSQDIYQRSISIFDYEMSIAYISFLELVFTVVSKSDDLHVYTVETWTGCGARRIGELRLTKDGKVTYNGEPIKTSKARSLYAKCLAFKG